MADYLEEEVSLKSAQEELSPADPFVGSLFENKYLILEKLGSGGYSRVYKALHVHLKKEFAIKVLHSFHAYDESTRARFTQEARTTSLLSHENIVAIHDYGYSEEMPYLVMDYIQGPTLAGLLSKGRQFSYSTFLHVCNQVCDALAMAHGKGIIHRDLKPENIMLLDSDCDKPQVKILDFGLAKMMQPEGESLIAKTQTGQVVGTPLYMSPEQCHGCALDERSDIYSFGCVMYELLTGSKPFDGEQALSILLKHMSDMPPAFSAAAGSRHIPASIEAVVFKTLAKDRTKRYSSMDELKAALLKACSQENNSLAAKISLLSARLALRRLDRQELRKMLALAAGVAIVVAGCMWFCFKQYEATIQGQVINNPVASWDNYDIRGIKAMNTADYQEAAAMLDQAISTASTFENPEKLISSLRKKSILCHILQQRKHELESDEQIKKLESRRQARSSVKPQVNAGVVMSTWDLLPDDPKQINHEKFENLVDQIIEVSRQYSYEGDQANAANLLAKVTPKIRQVLGSDSLTLMGALGEQGFALESMGNKKAAEPLLIEALAIAEKQFAAGNIKPFLAYIKLATALNPYKGDTWTLSEYDKALEMMKGFKGNYNEEFGFCRLQQAKVLKARGQKDKALEVLNQALEHFQKSNTLKKGPLLLRGTPECLSEIGQIQAENLQAEAAETSLKKAIAAIELQDHGDDPAVTEIHAWHLRALGIFFWQRHRFVDAEISLRKALELRQHLLSPEDKDTTKLLGELARLYGLSAKYKQSEPLLKQKAAIEERNKDAELLSTVAQLGCVYSACGRKPEALIELERYLSLSEQIRPDCYPSGDERYIFDLLSAGSQKDSGRFEKILLKGLEDLRKNPQLGKLAQAERCADLALLYSSQGKKRQAEARYREAAEVISREGITKNLKASYIMGEYSGFLVGQRRIDEGKRAHAQSVMLRPGQSDHTLFK